MSIINDTEEFRKHKWLAVYAAAYVSMMKDYLYSQRASPTITATSSAVLQAIKEHAVQIANEESEIK